MAPQRGTLHITLHDAKGLKAADASGFSDPYAAIGIGLHPSATNGTLVQSGVIKQNLNPIWEESFQVSGNACSLAPLLPCPCLVLLTRAFFPHHATSPTSTVQGRFRRAVPSTVTCLRV